MSYIQHVCMNVCTYECITSIISVKNLLPFTFSQYNYTNIKAVPRLVLKQILLTFKHIIPLEKAFSHVKLVIRCVCP